ncbi:MAG: hypothetical protein PHN69_02650 [Candidatus Pacebacteria bacterium]|nr:hypothetical protein [Candidatus Paceibacterota bacterium]
MLTTNIIQRVLFVNYNNLTGTAFTIEKNGKQYLISAKHIFPDLTTASQIKVFHDGSWKTLNITPIFCKDKNIDIIAFDIGSKYLTPVHKVNLGMSNIYYSQDAYFLGFPYGMFTDSGIINNNFPFPFAKKCIISAINKRIIYFDGHNNRGFSGGPVVIVEKDNLIKIIGVVSAFLGDSVNRTENSGIFYCHAIDNIIEVL